MEKKLEVNIEARDEKVTTDNKKLWPGVYPIPITDAVRTSAKLDKNITGLYTAGVYPETPSAIIGMQRGDLITAINGKPVKDLAGFYKTLREEAGKELQFGFTRNGTTLESLKFKR